MHPIFMYFLFLGMGMRYRPCASLTSNERETTGCTGCPRARSTVAPPTPAPSRRAAGAATGRTLQIKIGLVLAGDAEHAVVHAVALESQSRRIFQISMQAQACSTQARSLRWEMLYSASQAVSSVWPFSRHGG